jgi:hypothetical protein
MSSDDANTVNSTAVDKTADVSASRPKKRWTFWRVLGWLIASLLVIILIASAYVWQNRYSYLEQAVEDVLAQRGLEADISIRSIDKGKANLTEIDINAGGARVFSADKLQLEYEWREAIKGRMKRIEITGADIALKVDEKGRIIDGWMPEPDPNSELVLPPNGIKLTDAVLTLDSPYGLVKARGDVIFSDFEEFRADIEVTPSQFSFGALEVKGGGKILAEISPQRNDIKAALDFTDMVHPLGGLSYASVSADVTFDVVDGQSQVIGPIKLNFAELMSERLSAENGTLNWDGGFSVRPNSAVIRQADGRWSGGIKRMTYSDADGRDTLAQALTLNGPMAAAPVTTHFADGLTASVKALLSQADVKGAGEFYRLDEKVEVSLSEPLVLNSRTSNVILTPSVDGLFYDYNRDSEALNVMATAKLSGARAVTLKDLRLKARSPNGVSISDVESFSTEAVTRGVWTANSETGPVRLAPMTAKLRYINVGERRDLNVGFDAFDYDGPLPGGYVQGFNTGGNLALDLRDGALATRFVPSDGRKISLSKFETTTGWTAQETAFDIASDAPFFTRAPNTADAKLSVKLSNLTTALVESETGRRLDMTVADVNAVGDITLERQDWTFTAREADVKTDDFGGAGTVVGAPEAVIKAVLTPNADTQIDVTAEAARVRTDQISTQKMPIALTGTPTDFHLDFGGDSYASAGRVNFIGQALPELPLRGALDYIDGLIEGTAYTILPDTKDADIEIDFRLKDGSGTATVDIPDLTFMPGGLQPQNLVSALQGKIANVEGTVSAQIELGFEPNQPVQSFGRATLNDLDFGTLPGPFKGVSTQIEFSSIFPLVSSGVQRLTVDSFNPGVDLIDGVIEYELISGGVEILSAKWPLANGFISLDPTVWTFDAPENRVVLRIDGVSAGAFIGEAGGGSLTVTGDVVGTIPVVIAGVDVRIDEGRLGVKDGGVIQYRSKELTSVVDLIPEKYVTLQDYQQFKEFRDSEDPSENAGKDLAFTALRNFEYKSLAVKLDGPLDGEIEVNLRFIGRNPKILAGTEFDFNVTIIGELVNLVRGLSQLSPESSLDRVLDYLDLEDKPSEETIVP